MRQELVEFVGGERQGKRTLFEHRPQFAHNHDGNAITIEDLHEKWQKESASFPIFFKFRVSCE
jgi:hypothetical protein